MTKNPFNLRLPPDTKKVIHRGKHIGYIYPTKMPTLVVMKDMTRAVFRHERYGVMTLDGEVVTKNSRSPIEARKTLQRAIARRVSRRS